MPNYQNILETKRDSSKGLELEKFGFQQKESNR